MKLKKRIFRLALVVGAMAMVSYPLINQLRNSHATAQDVPPGATAPGIAPAPILTLPDVPKDKVVLSIGDEKVTAGEFAAFFGDLEPATQQQVLSHPELKHRLAEQYIDLKLMANEAKRLKLDQTSRVKTSYDQLLANALMVNLADQKDANATFFAKNKQDFEELQARHILIAVEGSGIPDIKRNDAQAKAKATEIKQRLDKGEDFAQIARLESDDKGSAPTGGSLGSFGRGRMVPEFESAAYALKDKEISGPVKTPYGYHIIQVLSRSTPAMEAVSQQIPRRRLEALIADIKKMQKPEIDDSYFGAGEKQADAPATRAAK